MKGFVANGLFGGALLLLIAASGARAIAQEVSPAASQASGGPSAEQNHSLLQSPTADQPAIGRGKRLYLKVGCSGCHGTVGQGAIGPMTGPRIGSRSDLPAEAFEYMLLHPAGTMPPYTEKVLSAAEVADLFAFLSTSFVPLKASDIPMLRTRQAQEPGR